MIRAILELLRPPNVATALADVLAGFGVARLADLRALPWLLLSTACLYAGGVALNDVFDRAVDRHERPERPIPSGRISAGAAAGIGGSLLLAGIAFAAVAGATAGAVALAIALAVVLYDAWGKRQSAIGPVNMGLCRALNLLLGIAAAPVVLRDTWGLGAIPLFYIAGVTTISRGEVHGGSRRAASIALVSLGAALLLLLGVALRAGDRALPSLVLAMVVAWRVAPAFLAARARPEPATIRFAVQRGVLSLVLVDATIATAYAGPLYGAVVLAAALLAGTLARRFAVT
jgi:4-hydroxybenzoate polyprenyltransferase